MLALVIFLSEMCVVTLGTLRIIFVARGDKVLAPVLGFFEILIWLFAISQVMQNLGDALCFIAFALGFTLGNLLGILIEKKLALGLASVRIITNRPAHLLTEQLRAASFGVTTVDGHGASGPVQIVMTVVKRRQLQDVLALIEEHHPNAFYAVDELQSTSEGIFPQRQPVHIPILPSALKFLRRLGLASSANRIDKLPGRSNALVSEKAECATAWPPSATASLCNDVGLSRAFGSTSDARLP